MKTFFSLAAVVATLLLSGCSLFRQNSPEVKPHPAATTVTPPTTNAVALASQHAQEEANKNKPAIVTPDTSMAAKVVAANTVGRFVVIGFPENQAPKLQQTLFLYRAGLKVAEIKVTGPQSENNIVADLVSGDAKIGDTVRDQ